MQVRHPSWVTIGASGKKKVKEEQDAGNNAYLTPEMLVVYLLQGEMRAPKTPCVRTCYIKIG
jgi:hypothetical protein